MLCSVTTRSSCCGCVLIGLLGTACASEPEPALASQPSAPAPGEGATTPSATAAEPDPALAELAALAVFDHDFARAELYTWTSVEQLAQVRASGRLLSADPSTGGRASPFNQALFDIERDGSAPALLASLLLDDPTLRRRRYAWPSPFATTLGLGGRRYGDSLIRIDLDDRALIGRFEPAAAEPFAFVDMRGQAVALAQALADPHRIAALYHLRSPPEAPIAYREYVVCNETMIRAWSLATPDIRARVEAEIALLDQLQAHTLAQLPRAAVLESAAPDWRRAPAPSTQLPPLALWHASLAFDNARYRPSHTNLEAIRAALVGYQDDGGPPLIQRQPDPLQPHPASPSTP